MQQVYICCSMARLCGDELDWSSNIVPEPKGGEIIFGKSLASKKDMQSSSGVGINTPTIVRIRQQYGSYMVASKDAPSIWTSCDAHSHPDAGIPADVDPDTRV